MKAKIKWLVMAIIAIALAIVMARESNRFPVQKTGRFEERTTEDQFVAEKAQAIEKAKGLFALMKQAQERPNDRPLTWVSAANQETCWAWEHWSQLRSFRGDLQRLNVSPTDIGQKGELINLDRTRSAKLVNAVVANTAPRIDCHLFSVDGGAIAEGALFALKIAGDELPVSQWGNIEHRLRQILIREFRPIAAIARKKLADHKLSAEALRIQDVTDTWGIDPAEIGFRREDSIRLRAQLAAQDIGPPLPF